MKIKPAAIAFSLALATQLQGCVGFADAPFNAAEGVARGFTANDKSMCDKVWKECKYKYDKYLFSDIGRQNAGNEQCRADAGYSDQYCLVLKGRNTFQYPLTEDEIALKFKAKPFCSVNGQNAHVCSVVISEKYRRKRDSKIETIVNGQKYVVEQPLQPYDVRLHDEHLKGKYLPEGWNADGTPTQETVLRLLPDDLKPFALQSNELDQ